MPRKFRFLGYGDRTPSDYSDESFNPDKNYPFAFVAITVGRVYECLKITSYSAESGLPDDIHFIDDEGDEMTQEIRFFEEVFDDEWHLFLTEPSEDELIMMDMNAEVLEADFTG